MKHLATIQKEFLKVARNWDDLSIEEQKSYIKRHPKSKRKITARPKGIANLPPVDFLVDDNWDDLPLEHQKLYLQRHPESKRKLTIKDSQQPDFLVDDNCDDLSYENQHLYLQRNPKSTRKITAKPKGIANLPPVDFLLDDDEDILLGKNNEAVEKQFKKREAEADTIGAKNRPVGITWSPRIDHHGFKRDYSYAKSNGKIINKTEAENMVRLDSDNKTTYMTKEEFEQHNKKLDKHLDDLGSSLSSMLGHSSNKWKH